MKHSAATVLTTSTVLLPANVYVGNVTGYPGVFLGNPCPYPSKPILIHKGMGFDKHGSRVWYNPWVSKPVWD